MLASLLGDKFKKYSLCYPGIYCLRQGDSFSTAISKDHAVHLFSH